jgi:hypothetical protein
MMVALPALSSLEGTLPPFIACSSGCFAIVVVGVGDCFANLVVLVRFMLYHLDVLFGQMLCRYVSVVWVDTLPPLLFGDLMHP